MDTKKAIEFVEKRICESPEKDQLLNLLKHGEKAIIECKEKMAKKKKTFAKELENLINHWSKENESNTPDFILANYLLMCLRAGEYLVNTRDQWYKK